MINRDYLREVMADQKRFLKMSEVRWVNVPQFEELSVQAIYPIIAKDAEVKIYFPEKLAKNKLPDRDYMYNVVNTLRPEYVKNLVE
jgi:hypothetical protein